MTSRQRERQHTIRPQISKGQVVNTYIHACRTTKMAKNSWCLHQRSWLH
jgi:hypothetical protein